MLRLKNLSKDYFVASKPVRVLRDINISFRKHEFVSILGESGSGKTTLLNLIGGLDLSSEGEIIIDGQTTKNYSSKDWDAYRNHRIGFVFQDYNLISHLTVVDNVELSLSLGGYSKQHKRTKTIELLTKLGLQDHLYKKPNQLSGGQQQRVAIARALINEPDIILADEPTGSLDSKTSIEFMNLLKSVSKDKLIILVTHNENLANEYSNRIITLVDGKVTSDTNPYIIEDIKLEKPVQPLKSAMSYGSALLLSLKNLLTKKFRTIITAIAASIGIIGIALTLALKNGFDVFIKEMNQENFVNMPIQVAVTQTNIDDLLNPPRYIRVINAIAGYEPPSTIIHNKLENFIPFLEDTIEPESKSVVYEYNYGYSFSIIHPVTNARQSQSSSIVLASRYKDDDIYDQFKDVPGAQIDSDEPYQAYLVVNHYNRAENRILEFLNLPLDQDIPYDDVLGMTFQVGNNTIGYVDLVITKIVTPRSEVSDIRTGVYYNNALKEYLAEKSEIKTIRRISIYGHDLENKNEIKALIAQYNRHASEEDYITYLDKVEVVSDVANMVTVAATIILISFSAISLLVSSIMISIITYTSVLERTNEIGVLRSVGARKKDISRVFNAEVIIIGVIAGLLGIGMALLIIPVINYIVEPLLEYSKLAKLKISHGIILIGLSVLVTLVAGFVPSLIASKKDPVKALRSN